MCSCMTGCPAAMARNRRLPIRRRYLRRDRNKDENARLARIWRFSLSQPWMRVSHVSLLTDGNARDITHHLQRSKPDGCESRLISTIQGDDDCETRRSGASEATSEYRPILSIEKRCRNR